MQQVLQDTDKRAQDLADEVFQTAKRAIDEAKAQGVLPASSDPQETHDYVQRAFEISDGLAARLQTAKGLPSIYEVSIVDHDGVAFVSSDDSLPGKVVTRRPALAQLVQSPFVRQVRILAERKRIYEVDYPFSEGGRPFGEVRVAVSTPLLFEYIKPSVRSWLTIVALALVLSTILAALVSGWALTPIRDILAQLERISAGVYDTPTPSTKGKVESTDELGQVRRKITQVGQQLRGVHEIFSSLRENMNSVMAGLEDGLILFTRDARAR